MPECDTKEMYNLVCKDRFDGIEETVSDRCAEIKAGVEKRFDKLDATVGKIFARLEGNGHDGLIGRTIKLEQKADVLNARWKQVFAIVAALVIAVVGRLLYDWFK